MKEMETKTQMEPQGKGKKSVLSKILNVVITVLIVFVLIISIMIAILALTSKSSGISTIFGYTIQPIQSDSMKGGSPDGYPGGDFEAGDLMIAKATNYDPDAVYEVGDIITFRTADSDGNIMLIAHRIVDVNKNSNGTYSYQTQGDNRETSPVSDQAETEDYITAFDIGSVFYSDSYQGTILKGCGKVLDFLQTQQGFFLVILLPMIVFFLYAVVRVVLNFTNYKKAKAEEEKESAVDAAVAAALAEKEAESSSGISPEHMTPEQLEQFKQFLAMQEAEKAKEDKTQEE